MPTARTPSRRTLTVVGAAALLVVVTAGAQAHKSAAERAVEYRQSLYIVIANNFAPLGAMAEGKIPFDAAKAQVGADRVAFLAPLLKEAFPAESNGIAHTEAKPEVWSDPAGFGQALQNLIDKSAALSVAAKSGDASRFNAAVQETGKACKGCHDKYKVKD